VVVVKFNLASKLKWLPLLCLSATIFSGCGFISAFKGDGAPKRTSAELKSNSSPEFSTIFDDDDARGEESLSIWRNNAISSFDQIEGHTKDFLSPHEIEILVRAGFIKLADQQDVSVARAKTVLALLGFSDGVSRLEISALFDWLEEHRPELRIFYHQFLSNDGANAWNSTALLNLVHVFGSLLELGGDHAYSASDMATLINPWIPEDHPHAKHAMNSAFDMGISFFASFCGDRVDNANWNGKKIGLCLHEAADHFQSMKPTFDYILGNLDPLEQRESLKTSAADMPVKIKSWLEGHNHPSFPTSKILEFSKQLDVPAPYAFFELISWLPLLSEKSTKESFNPLFFVGLSSTINHWIQNFLTATEKQSCHVPWRECVFTGEFLPADQLYSAEYATLIRSKNLAYVNKIALYDSIAEFMMRNVKDDAVHELIQVAIRLLDSNAFANNVISRLQEKPIDSSNTEDSLKKIKRNGLAEVAALVSELIPMRDTEGRSVLRELSSNLSNTEKKYGYTLDKTGVTAFLYVYDLIGSMRDDYLTHYDLPVYAEGTTLRVKRKKVMAMLPQMLADHFPRIREQCDEWGLERTCGVVFSEALPSPGAGRDDIETYEIDVVSIAGILIESMMNRCDRNGDGEISSNILDGFDEQHCMLTASTVLVTRLMHANILREDSKTVTLMNIMTKLFPVRWAAKNALSRGTLKGIWVHAIPPFSLIQKPATLGSILSLAAELMNTDKVNAIEADVIGPVEKPGDELIYHHQWSEGARTLKRD
jgi:hypothetical protein